MRKHSKKMATRFPMPKEHAGQSAAIGNHLANSKGFQLAANPILSKLFGRPAQKGAQ